MIIGCDANSQHTIWGSTKCNRRGEKLLDFILSYNLVIHNKGDSPTFINKVRQEVIDMTLTNQKASCLIQNWSVLNEDSLSDHRYIGFDIGADKTVTPTGRNPRKTNWTTFTKLVENRMGNHRIQRKLSNVAKLNEYTNLICDTLVDCYKKACPVRKERSGKSVPWWSRDLDKLRKASRKLLNRAMKTRKEEDWDAYKLKQKEYI